MALKMENGLPATLYLLQKEDLHVKCCESRVSQFLRLFSLIHLVSLALSIVNNFVLLFDLGSIYSNFVKWPHHLFTLIGKFREGNIGCVM